MFQKRLQTYSSARLSAELAHQRTGYKEGFLFIQVTCRVWDLARATDSNVRFRNDRKHFIHCRHATFDNGEWPVPDHLLQGVIVLIMVSKFWYRYTCSPKQRCTWNGRAKKCLHYGYANRISPKSYTVPSDTEDVSPLSAIHLKRLPYVKDQERHIIELSWKQHQPLTAKQL